MKKHFFGYYEMTEDQFRQLWKNCIFVVDTNVLLDMYRLSPSARDTLIDVLSQIKDRLWVPYQVASEYHKDISNVILDQISNCKEMSSLSAQLINKILAGCESSRSYPYLSDTLQEKIRAIAKEIDKEIAGETQELVECINNNSTKDRIAVLLEGRLWERLEDRKLDEIEVKGRKRYEAKIPPGYGDMKTKKGNDVYGDLIIWEEIIAYASNNKKDVIFITNDTNKDDWFITVSKKLKGPRAELRMEFAQRTNGKTYYAYPTSAFLQHVGEYVGISKVSDTIIDEVASMIVEKATSESSGTTDSYNETYQFVTGEIGQIDESASES